MCSRYSNCSTSLEQFFRNFNIRWGKSIYVCFIFPSETVGLVEQIIMLYFIFRTPTSDGNNFLILFQLFSDLLENGFNPKMIWPLDSMFYEILIDRCIELREELKNETIEVKSDSACSIRDRLHGKPSTKLSQVEEKLSMNNKHEQWIIYPLGEKSGPSVTAWRWYRQIIAGICF